VHPAVHNPARELVLDQSARRAGLVMSLTAGTLIGGFASMLTAKKIGWTAAAFPVVGAATGLAAWAATWSSGYDPRGLV
jgi:uncharacterized protein YfiM (DUF2279 family)